MRFHALGGAAVVMGRREAALEETVAGRCGCSARRSSHLAEWLEAVLHLYGDRILAFDTPTARMAGRSRTVRGGTGQSPGFADIAIAATARQHGLTILSRNLRHFEPLGVSVLDPFVSLPRP